MGLRKTGGPAVRGAVGAFALLACLLLSGCFVAAQSLLTRADLSQPISQSTWAVFVQQSEETIAKMPAAEFSQKKCQRISGTFYCRSSAERMTPLADGSYLRQTVASTNRETIRLSDVGGRYYIVESPSNAKGEVEYDLARMSVADDGSVSFAIYHPTCKDQTSLHDLAPPRPSDPNYCVIPSRANLMQLMGRVKTLVLFGGQPNQFWVKG